MCANNGKIEKTCPACKGTGLVWSEKIETDDLFDFKPNPLPPIAPGITIPWPDLYPYKPYVPYIGDYPYIQPYLMYWNSNVSDTLPYTSGSSTTVPAYLSKECCSAALKGNHTPDCPNYKPNFGF